MTTVTDVANLIRALDNPDAIVRFNAACELGELPPDPSVDDALVKRLQGNDTGANSAAWVLATRGPQSAVPALVASLTSEDLTLRQYATFALGNLAEQSGTLNEEVVAALIRCLEDYKDSELRLLAADALGKTNHPNAIEPLQHHAIFDTDIEGTAYHAALAIAKIDSPDRVSALVRCLLEGDFIAKEHATKALMKINDPQVVTELVKALSNPHPVARRAAGKALNKLPDRLLKEGEVVAKLVEILSNFYSTEDKTDKEAINRSQAAIEVIHRLPDKLLKEGLPKCLKKENSVENRLAVLKSLPFTCDPRVTPALVKIMIDENEEESLRHQAQESLNNMDGELQLRGLVACLGDDNPDVCSFAKNILGKIERPQAVVTRTYAG